MIDYQEQLHRLTNPESLLMIAIIAALALMLLVAAARLRKGRYPYRRRGPLFSPAELRFFRVLERAVNGETHIHAKVRLADLITVRSGFSGRRFWKAFNGIACKHVDYVLCDRQAQEVLCVIELDDRSHERRDRQERDAFVDAAMRSAGIPILHFPVQSRYAPSEIRDRLRHLLPRGNA